MSDTRLEALEALVQQLLDREAIGELKARYFRYVDEKNWSEWRKLFTDDAEFDFGSRVLRGADAFVNDVSETLEGTAGYGRTVHRGHMPELVIDSPTEAHGRWGLADYIEWPSDPDTGERHGYRGYGHEIETYRKVNGDWKIASWRLSYIRMDPLPRSPLPDGIVGGPERMHDTDYVEAMTSTTAS